MPALPAENGKKGEIRNSPRRPFSLLPLSFFHSFPLFSLPLSEGAFPPSSLPRSKGAFPPFFLPLSEDAFPLSSPPPSKGAFPPSSLPRFKGAFPPFPAALYPHCLCLPGALASLPSPLLYLSRKASLSSFSFLSGSVSSCPLPHRSASISSAPPKKNRRHKHIPCPRCLRGIATISIDHVRAV